MQILIDIPNTLPQVRIKQRIKEFEQSLREEANFLTILIKTTLQKHTQKQAIMNITQECVKLPTIDPRSSDEILKV